MEQTKNFLSSAYYLIFPFENESTYIFFFIAFLGVLLILIIYLALKFAKLIKKIMKYKGVKKWKIKEI